MIKTYRTCIFKKDDMIALANKEVPEGYEIVKTTLCDTSRWSLHYEQIFKFKNVYYQTTFERGATESQDERPYDYDEDYVVCYEVVPEEINTVMYKKVEIND